MTEIWREPLNRRDLLACRIRGSLDAGPNRFAIQMDCASATLGHAATVFGSRQPKRIAKHPDKRRLRIYIDVELFAVNFEINHKQTPLCWLYGYNGFCGCRYYSRSDFNHEEDPDFLPRRARRAR